MASTQRRLILGNGEQYVQPLAKVFTGRTPRSSPGGHDR